MKAFGYVAAALGGVVVGATTALLFAPEKGEETRAKIKDSVKDFCDEHDIDSIKETIQNFCDKYKIGLSNKQAEELADELLD